jgi:hypothetical protein
MAHEDLVSISSKRWPCAVAGYDSSELQSAHPNNFHATKLCPPKAQELVCIYTARSPRPPAGCSSWVWIGPLAPRVKRGSGAGSWGNTDPFFDTLPWALGQTERLEGYCYRPRSLVHSCKTTSQFDCRIFSSETMNTLCASAHSVTIPSIWNS